MKKNKFFLVILAIFIVAACNRPCPSLTDLQKSETEKQILELWNKINVPVEKADAEGYLSYFSSDEFNSMFSGGNSFYSLKEYADSVKTWFSTRKSSEISGKKVKVTILSENLALLDQSSVFQATFKDDSVIRINHAVSFLFKRGPLGWKIIYGHESMKE